MKRKTHLALLLLALAAGGAALGFYGTSQAASPKDIPFPNPAQQRIDTVAELRLIAGLLKEQNQLLKEQTAILKEINEKTDRRM